jgi:hypothetical protein
MLLVNITAWNNKNSGNNIKMLAKSVRERGGGEEQKTMATTSLHCSVKISLEKFCSNDVRL